MKVTDPNPFTVRNWLAGTAVALALSFSGCAEEAAAPVDPPREVTTTFEVDQTPQEPEPLRPAPPPALTGDAAVIAACESGGRLRDGTALLGTHDWTAQNPESTASGAFQFINGTWEWTWHSIIGEPAPTLRAREALPEQQLRAFLALWKDRVGAGHWEASSSCWKPMLG